MCFMLLPEQGAIISIYNINREGASPNITQQTNAPMVYYILV